MADLVKQILARPIQLADQVTKAAEEASTSKQECSELKSKTEKLAALLRQAARASSDLHERPARRIIEDTERVLDKALALVLRCRDNGIIKRVFHMAPTAAFRKMSSHLESSISDISWLLGISASFDDGARDLVGLPPIAVNEPMLYLIWEQIAILCTGSLEDRSDAAASLASLALDNYRNGMLIIEEGGVGPLLKLLKEGKSEGQENAACALGRLGRDAEIVEHMIHAGACSVFAKILKEGPMKVQAMVAWAVSELAANSPACSDLFAQHNVIRLLVSHLAFETIQEHGKYAIASKATSIHAVVMAKSSNSDVPPSGIPAHNNIRSSDGERTRIPHPMGNQQPNQMRSVVTTTMEMNSQAKSQSTNSNARPHHRHQPHGHSQPCLHHSGASSLKGAKELEDPATKVLMKAMAAKALWHLAAGNPSICRSITESRALLCFAVLIEKGPEEVQFNCAMALMEVTAVAEHNTELRRSAFKPNSPSCKAVVDQLLRIIEKGESILLVPCIKAIGNLARTFRATETRMIRPLVCLLDGDDRDVEILREASIALAKFACSENYLHIGHSKEIVNADGAKHLVQLVYFGEPTVRIPALLLLCYIALHVPDDEKLADAPVLTVLEWASKQGFMVHDEKVVSLLQEAEGKLELYQSRGSRGFH